MPKTRIAEGYTTLADGMTTSHNLVSPGCHSNQEFTIAITVEMVAMETKVSPYLPW